MHFDSFKRNTLLHGRCFGDGFYFLYGFNALPVVILTDVVFGFGFMHVCVFVFCRFNLNGFGLCLYRFNGLCIFFGGRGNKLFGLFDRLYVSYEFVFVVKHVVCAFYG